MAKDKSTNTDVKTKPVSKTQSLPPETRVTQVVVEDGRLVADLDQGVVR